MRTLTADDYQRVRLPRIKPRSKFAYEQRSNGTIILRPVKADTEDPFPPDCPDLIPTKGENREMLQILQGCVQGPK